MIKYQITNNTSVFYRGDKQIASIAETAVEDGVLFKLDGTLVGDLDHYLQDELYAFTSLGLKIVLDFSGLTYAASSALDAILNTQQLIDQYFNQGDIYLHNIPEAIYQEMAEIGLVELLQIKEEA